MNLKNKVVVITGASQGIGREIAFLFAKEGARVVITYNKSEKEAKNVETHCMQLKATDVLTLPLNLKNNESIKEAVHEIIASQGKIDILINNAGVIAWKPLSEQSFEEIEDQLRTNLEGLIKFTLLCLPHVKETILNISSGAGLQGFVELAPYCASKFGVRGFTQSLAQEYPNLKIFSVNPGMTSTKMTNFKGTSPEKVANIVLNSAKGSYKVPSGGDINVWEYLK